MTACRSGGLAYFVSLVLGTMNLVCRVSGVGGRMSDVGVGVESLQSLFHTFDRTVHHISSTCAAQKD
jgi:hypothetical protein